MFTVDCCLFLVLNIAYKKLFNKNLQKSFLKKILFILKKFILSVSLFIKFQIKNNMIELRINGK